MISNSRQAGQDEKIYQLNFKILPQFLFRRHQTDKLIITSLTETKTGPTKSGVYTLSRIQYNSSNVSLLTSKL